MLRTRHLVILAAVLVVLALTSFLQRDRHARSTRRAATSVLVAGAWTIDDLSRVTLGFGDEPEVVAMSGSPQGWVLDTSWGATVSTDRLVSLLRSVSGLDGEFRSEQASVLADYGLAGSDGVTIRGFDATGTEAFALQVGDKPERHPGSFVRRPGEDAVYLTATSLLSPLGLYNGPERPSGRHFLELQVLDLESQDVDTITLLDEHGERRLMKEFTLTEPAPGDTTATGPEVDRLTWEWRLDAPGGGALTKTKTDAVLGAACRLRAVDVGDPTAPAADYGLDAPDRRAVLTMADGREIILSFGSGIEADDAGPAGVWLRLGDEPTVWLVNDFAVTGIFKTVEELGPAS